MIKRTIEISADAAHLSTRNSQLVLKREGETVGSVPWEDVGLVLVDHPQTTYSHAALNSLLESQAALVVCGRDHLPQGLLLPLGDHSEIVWRVHDQVAASLPLKKRLWKQIVQAKIRAQADNVACESPARRKLLQFAGDVKSGDSTNREAQAAKVYWRVWLQTGDAGDDVFRRRRDGVAPNALLNYGYTVLRAAVARAIVAAGLLPTFGLHHSNRSNAFCLADDLIEPLRPLVDDCVRSLYFDGCTEIDRPAKQALLELLTVEVVTGEAAGPLMVALHRYAASLVKCYQGDARQLDIPVFVTNSTLNHRD